MAEGQESLARGQHVNTTIISFFFSFFRASGVRRFVHGWAYSGLDGDVGSALSFATMHLGVAVSCVRVMMVGYVRLYRDSSLRSVNSAFGTVFSHLLSQRLLLRTRHVDNILHTLPRALACRRRGEDLLQHGL